MTKLSITIVDGVSRSQAMVFVGAMLNKVEDAPFKPKTDYPVLFEWGDLRAIYHLTPGGKHSFTVQPKR